MPTFALITEGITDQVVIQCLISSHYKNSHEMDEIYFSILQPIRDNTDQSRIADKSFGGWEQVLEFCADPERLEEALSFNDYVIIQIDSDFYRHPSININTDQKQDKIINDAKGLLTSKFTELYTRNSDKFIFAISIHSTECWILAAYAEKESEKGKINNCEHALIDFFYRKKKRIEKTYRCYKEISKKFTKTQILKKAALNSESLKIFLNSLPKN